MGLTRRQLLIATGAVVGGAGAFAATGAFDTVEAQRNFELEVSGDAGALLGLEAVNTQIVTVESGGAGGSDIIAFDIDANEGLNEGAATDFFGAFRITNNGSQDVHVSIDTGNANGVEFNVEGGNLNSLTSEADLADGGAVWQADEDALVDISIDTNPGGYVEPSQGNNGNPYQMTITATTDF